MQLRARVHETLSDSMLSHVFAYDYINGSMHNGKLSLLGDSLLRLYITEHLIVKRPNLPDSSVRQAVAPPEDDLPLRCIAVTLPRCCAAAGLLSTK